MASHEGFGRLPTIEVGSATAEASEIAARALDLHGLKVGVREVVGDHHIESGLDQLDGRVRSDVSGAARYQYCFFHKAMSFEFLNF